MEIEILVADYSNPRHGQDIVELLNSYACDPMGGGEPLADYVKENLASELNRIPNAFSVLCYADDVPVGLVNCLIGFSTFKCKPLVNIHDVVVLEKFRRKQICARLLDEVQRVANERGCCKLTLEVLEGNLAAKKAYAKFGFSPYQLDETHGNALFWEKAI